MKYVTCYHCLYNNNSTQLFMLGYAKMTKISISQLQLLHYYFVFLLSVENHADKKIVVFLTF